MIHFDQSPWGSEYRRFQENSAYAREKTLRELSALVGRELGERWVDRFSFELQPEGETDCFTLCSRDGRICVTGGNGVSLASGLNFYLKQYAHVSYNPIFGSQLKMPEALPALPEPIVRKTPYQVRYALNFCTYGYTMAFWGWKEYEALLDWLAMNGVNLMLDIVGQEEVQRRFLMDFGYTDEEVKRYITGPAYLPWFYMQNMTSFGGPLPEGWFEDRVELGRRMHDRMQTLGISPVLMGYSGMVPQDFADKHPDAGVIPQGDWCGFPRPYMLKTYGTAGAAGKDWFSEAADRFYARQREVFGRVTRYFAVDPFHEGGRMGGMDPTRVYYTVQKKMLEQEPEAIWLLQQWQGQITDEKIRRLADPGRVLILDLQADRRSYSEVMERSGTPWLWCMVHNFGGRMGIDGDLPVLAEDLPKAYHRSRYMVGLGIAPEALIHSPVVYDLIFDMAWTEEVMDCRAYLEQYVHARYGVPDAHLLRAWSILLDTALARKKTYAQGAPESIVCAQPCERFKAASTWGGSALEYDPKELEQALPELLAAWERCRDCENYRYDLIDLARQVLATGAAFCHKRMMQAYDRKDSEGFRQLSALFLEMIRLTDDLLRCSPAFSLEPWLEQARHAFPHMTLADRELFEFNARALITTWGARENCVDCLQDYSNRQWAGLVREYYLPRWEDFVRRYEKSLETGLPPEPKDYFPMEWAWANRKGTEAQQQPLPDLKALAQQVYDCFSVTALERRLGVSGETGRIDLAAGRAVTCNLPAAEGYPAGNLTDGRLDTVWKAGCSSWPVTLEVDLGQVCEVREVLFAFPQVAGEFPVECGIELLQEEGWQQLCQLRDSLIGTVSARCAARASAVRLTLTPKEPGQETTAELAAIQVLGIGE
ncbi:MAG: alpha-N-acetylglucosaminidase TIM-barrel domain-containing protein [Oscillospiraceae bacterium]|nr:alpha-N-acetylglucosaminidase TIM-barrel domain-containing protein [Oscillospiraceae bacterium]